MCGSRGISQYRDDNRAGIGNTRSEEKICSEMIICTDARGPSSLPSPSFQPMSLHFPPPEYPHFTIQIQTHPVPLLPT